LTGLKRIGPATAAAKAEAVALVEARVDAMDLPTLAPLVAEPSENLGGKGGGVVHVVLISSEATPYGKLPHYT